MHTNKLLPVFAKVEVVTEEIKPTDQLPITEPIVIDPSTIEPPVQESLLEPQKPIPTRLTKLCNFRVLKRITRTKRVKIVEVIGDRRYFVSQASLVKTERASRIHAEVLAILSAYLASFGLEVSETFLIDAFAELQGPNIFEVKSINSGNEKSQIRHAIAQLYEYRYIYGIRDARLWLVLSRQPETVWILDYLVADRDIAVLWVQDGHVAGKSLDMLSQMLVSVFH